MKSFTPTEFRADSSTVYNAVMVDGGAQILHRDRPPMILMTLDKLSEIKMINFKQGSDLAKGMKK